MRSENGNTDTYADLTEKNISEVRKIGTANSTAMLIAMADHAGTVSAKRPWRPLLHRPRQRT
jgi:hypothetical protein